MSLTFDGTVSIIFWSTIWQVDMYTEESAMALMVTLSSELKMFVSAVVPSWTAKPFRSVIGSGVVPFRYSVTTALSYTVRVESRV